MLWTIKINRDTNREAQILRKEKEKLISEIKKRNSRIKELKKELLESSGKKEQKTDVFKQSRKKNAKHVRGQLDKIHIAIESGTFKFAEVFPQSKKGNFSKNRWKQIFYSDMSIAHLQCHYFP